jgi:hypothetical protein
MTKRGFAEGGDGSAAERVEVACRGEAPTVASQGIHWTCKQPGSQPRLRLIFYPSPTRRSKDRPYCCAARVRNLCRFYGTSGEEIISIGADVNLTTEPPHATAA